MEVKGAWSAPGASDLGAIAFTSAYHTCRTFSVKTSLAATSTYRLKRAESFGYFTLHDTQPAVEFPTKRHPYRNALAVNGVAEQPVLKQQLQEANKCGSCEEVVSTSPRAHPWVYYPWRRSMIQTPAPDLFWKVRQDRNRYKLTLNEMDMLRTKRIGVVGLSVGASIAYCLAHQGMCGELRIADFDDLELSNMNRLSTSLLDLDLPKVDIATRRIAEINPFLFVRAFEKGVALDNVDEFLRGLNVVVEECDPLDIKLLIRKRARHFGIPVLMETSDNGLLDVERFDLEDAQPFHGLVPDLPLAELATSETKEKVPYELDLLGVENLSSRFGAFLVEIDKNHFFMTTTRR